MDHEPENKWSFFGLITDIPLISPPRKIKNSTLEITGDEVCICCWKSFYRDDTRVIAKFDVDDISEVTHYEGSSSVGSAVLAGVIGGLVGGSIYVIIKLKDGGSLAFDNGAKTNRGRQATARKVGEIKQAITPLNRSIHGPSTTMQTDTKVCPYCAETIKAKAIRCRYCGSDLSR